MGQKGCQTECQNMFAACIYFQMVCRNHVRNWIVRRGGDLRKYFSLVTKISKIHAASISVYYRYLIHTTRKNRPIFNSISIQHGGPHTYITYAKCMYLPYIYIYIYIHTHTSFHISTQIWWYKSDNYLENHRKTLHSPCFLRSDSTGLRLRLRWLHGAWRAAASGCGAL